MAGLSAGIALRCVGCDVTIYERSTAALRGRGGGLVLQHEMLEWMRDHDIATTATLSVPGVERQFLKRDGGILSRMPDSTPFTSWDAVFHQLRAAFPDDRYRLARTCTSVENSADHCTLHFTDGDSTRADLVIGADGVGSIVRRALYPETEPAYAGYVAWRGVFPEDLAPLNVQQALEGRFTLYQGPDFHLLCYLIPGAKGELEPGKRRWNWVWYLNTDEHTELPQILTDREGRRHRAALEQERLQPRFRDELRERATATLPPVLADLVHATPAPFVLVIFDLLTPGMFQQRAILIGDSASLVRPHTAAGTAKASGDAVALAPCLQAHDFDWQHALPRWEAERRAVAERLRHHGWNLARRSGLGV